MFGRGQKFVGPLLTAARKASSSYAAADLARRRPTALEVDRLADKIKSITGNVSLSEAVRSQHSQDEGPEHGLLPDVVVCPQSTEQVSEVVIIAC